jgi:hypothetical protein
MTLELELVEEMRAFGFTLSGSRSMFPIIKVEAPTDWDLVCPDHQDYYNVLSDNNFFDKNTNSQYCDDNTITVFMHEALNIECVIKRDIALHNRVFSKIKPDFYMKYLWKSAPFPYFNERNDIKDRINMLLSYEKQEQS